MGGACGTQAERGGGEHAKIWWGNLEEVAQKT